MLPATQHSPRPASRRGHNPQGALITAGLVLVAVAGVSAGAACIVAFYGDVLVTPALALLAMAGSATIAWTLPHHRAGRRAR